MRCGEVVHGGKVIAEGFAHVLRAPPWRFLRLGGYCMITTWLLAAVVDEFEGADMAGKLIL